jgi:hypothetical protein
VSATLDAILAKVMSLAGAPVLFVARRPIHYQKGSGVGRRQFQEAVLLVHPKDADHMGGTWALPDMDVAGDAQIDTPVPFGDVLLARCDSEFKPAVDREKYDVTWTCVDFAVACDANDPKATAAIKEFLASTGDHKVTGEMVMDSRKDFIDAQAAAEPTYRLFGDSAPPPMQGEPRPDYEARLVHPYQQFSKSFKGADLAKIGCPITRRALAAQIHSDAAAALHSGATVPAGELRGIVTMDGANRPITHYVSSDSGACWNKFAPPIRYVTRFNTAGRV